MEGVKFNALFEFESSVKFHVADDASVSSEVFPVFYWQFTMTLFEIRTFDQVGIRLIGSTEPNSCLLLPSLYPSP